MRKIWLMAAAVAALAACQPGATDPIAEAQRAWEYTAGQEQIAACTTVIDAEVVEAEVRTEALTLRAAARREAGEVTLALRDYEAALQADENNVPALLGRADI